MAQYNSILNIGRVEAGSTVVGVSIGTQTDPRQVRNDAGGFVYQAHVLTELERWFILGAEGNTYYVSQATQVKRMRDNFLSVLNHADWRVGKAGIDLAVNISVKGRAPKQDPVLYFMALAVKVANPYVRLHAQRHAHEVIRTASALFMFNSFIEGASRGRGLRTLMSGWYDEKESLQLAYQVAKYRNRYGFTHRDVMLLGHVRPRNQAHNVIMGWAIGKDVPFFDDEGVRFLCAVDAVGRAEDEKIVTNLIAQHNLPREVIPTQWLNSPRVWKALSERMPVGALVRNIANLAKHGVLDADQLAGALTPERVVKGRLHPLNIYNAIRMNAGLNAKTLAVLEGAFDASFGALPVFDEPIHYTIDTSGSMNANINGMQGVSCVDGGALYGMILERQFPNSVFTVFNTTTEKVNYYGRGLSMKSIIQKVNSHGGGTNVEQAIRWHGTNVPNLNMVLFSDMQSWHGGHPYRTMEVIRRGNPNFKLVAVMAEGGSAQISKPEDLNTLNVSGFDLGASQVIAGFFGKGVENVDDSD